MQEICGILKNSSAYRDYLLQIAAQKRSAVIAYLQQEITFKESFAFIEYWGRGYTQDCLTRLLSEAAGYTIDTPMYYVRSIYPTVGHSIRYNYSSNMHSLVFVESIFANVPYETVQRYERAENIWKPVLTPNNNNVRLHAALETYLPTFCHDFCPYNYKTRKPLADCYTISDLLTLAGYDRSHLAERLLEPKGLCRAWRKKRRICSADHLQNDHKLDAWKLFSYKRPRDFHEKILTAFPCHLPRIRLVL